VAVCVGLDDPGDVYRRADDRADIAVIASDLLARDQHIGAERSGHLFILPGRERRQLTAETQRRGGGTRRKQREI
jgi:hypothetical protein